MTRIPAASIGRRQATQMIGATALGLTAGRAGAQDLSGRPVTIVVQYAPGGSTDIAARILAQFLAPELGQSVLVENRPGGAGNVGFDAVVRSKPDGSTLLVTNLGPITVSPHTMSTLSIDPITQLMPVAMVNRTPMMASVHPDVPSGSLQEFVAYVRSKREPLPFGTSGQGAIGHVAMMLVCQRLGITLEHVPYRGIAPALQDVIAGRLTAAVDSLVSMQGLVREGRLRGLFVTGAERSSQLPEVKTLAESGLPDLVFYGWNGLFAPAGTPASVITRLEDAVARALRNPQLRERFSGLGTEPGSGSSEQFAETVRAEHKRWGEVVRSAGIRVE
jgi:tripartite-type tricarboxylate transporter receptor subunit TctC